MNDQKRRETAAALYGFAGGVAYATILGILAVVLAIPGNPQKVSATTKRLKDRLKQRIKHYQARINGGANEQSR